MKANIKEKLRAKQIEFIIQSPEYIDALKDLASDISKSAAAAVNEATFVSTFEIELYSFIKETLGLKYHPEKEVSIDTIRHIAKGKIDSKIGALVIEFKYKSTLNSPDKKVKATAQIKDYLNGLIKRDRVDYWGIVTDGISCQILSVESGVLTESAFEKLSYKHLDKIVRSIVLLEKVALTSKNLIKDFCEPAESSLSHKLILCLYSTLKTSPTPRSIMLFNEWKELFRLAHDDKSKQKAIEERHKALEDVIGETLSGNDEEYLSLYAIQTTFAIIVKIIAFKVISKIKFNADLIDFNSLSSTADYETLRHQMNSLEEGAIFRSMGIGNLLEGDFFSWYSSNSQWNNEIGKLVKEVFAILTPYEDIAIFETGEKANDLFKDLFMRIIPDKVRHSLGEFYTPPWLADNLVTETLKLSESTSQWTALDPCAGSGTFITILIKKVLEETRGISKQKRLAQILKRVKAIDLNPLAVLTARINYFINIAPLISDTDKFEIPVYLGDSSYVPTKTKIGTVECFEYKIKTMKGDIAIDLPVSAISNPHTFSKTMTSIEDDIRNSDAEGIAEKLMKIVAKKDRTDEVKINISSLASKFVELEQNDWNGIWARIVTNFLTTANLGKFDIIVGNPPWIDWKNLPAGYRERIKSICIDRELFSGDSLTGGINLNICALISSVAAQNWLKKNGVLSFLMPQTLIFQQTYEGFRNFKLDGKERLYIQQLFDWTEAGHPFAPVQHKFLTFFFSNKKVSYEKGLPVSFFVKNSGINLLDYQSTNDYGLIEDKFTIRKAIAGQVSKTNTIFSYATSAKELAMFKKISGESVYAGREGIEFYPQELFLLEVSKDIKGNSKVIYVKNYQNDKSKYKIPQQTFPLEKKYLHPLIKGVDIERFHIRPSEFIVPFPYDNDNFRSPLPMKKLVKTSKLLSQYFNRFKKVFESQTGYNERIIGEAHNNEFYALARVGEYSFAEHHVAFRDNTKWQAAVVSSVRTPWGELKRPQFQNHAVSISQREDGKYISLKEAHFICAILNAPITRRYILNSSDSRSFKIRPQIFIPSFDAKSKAHNELAKLSIQAHKVYDNPTEMEIIDKRLDELVILAASQK